MKTKFNKKKIISISIALISTFSISFILASCSQIDSSLISNSISKDNGKKFSTNISLEEMIRESAKSEVGMQAILNYYSGKMSLNWLENVASQPDQIIYRNLIEDKKKEIDKEYSNSYNEYKKNNNVNADLLFQQNVLDLSGGTESSWKESKLFEWAKSEVSTKIFEKNYLTIKENGVSKNNLSETDMLNALNASKANFNPVTNSTISPVVNGFSFSDDAIASGKNIYVDIEYSKFQQFIYDNWAQMDAPFIVNMSLWKYSQPEKGINDLFSAATAPTTDEEGNSTGGGANYQFPYFSDQRTNQPTGTITKFHSFVTNANNNYIKDVATGLKNIPKIYTDDSSTYILSKNSKIYNDLYIEFSAAASYLFKSLISNTTLDTNLKKGSNINVVKQSNNKNYDTISLNFINNTKSNLNNNKAITLKRNLIAEIINELGPLSNLIMDTHVIDAFIPLETALNEFIFLRNEAGVHAISVDGSNYIKSNYVNKNNSKYNAANVVLYRSLWSGLNSDQLTIDIKSELNSFFNDWTNFLIIKYALASENNLFSEKSLSLSAEEKDFIGQLNQFALEEKMFPKQREYQNKLFSAKNVFAKNFGIATKNNGFAAPWIYPGIQKGGQGEFLYDLTENLFAVNDPYATNGSQASFLISLTNLLNSLVILPLESSFAGFKYSQYIYSDKSMLNSSLLAYGNDGNSFGNKIKSNIIKEYLGTDVNDKLEFTNTLIPNAIDLKNINNYANNLYFSSVFNAADNKWENLDTNSLTNINVDIISNHIKQSWIDSNKKNNSKSTDAYISFLSFAATAKYLLSNNSKEFLDYLQNQILFGQDTYIAWLSSQNTYLTPQAQISATSAALQQKINVNINNSFKSIYTNTNIVANTNPLDINNDASSLFTNGNANYYNIVGSKVGFLGLQTKEKNELPSIISKNIFDKPKINNINGTGILYSYKSENDLISTINSFSLIYSVENLATELSNKTGAIDLNAILDKNKTLEEKKQELIQQIKKSLNSSLISQIYSARDNDFALSTDEVNNRLQYAVSVKQLNTNDTISETNLIARIGKDAFYNIVISLAMDTNVQNAALLSISETRKTIIYDVRLNKQLGSQWAKNWIAQ